MEKLKDLVTKAITKELAKDSPDVGLLDVLNRLLGGCIHATINKVN